LKKYQFTITINYQLPELIKKEHITLLLFAKTAPGQRPNGSSKIDNFCNSHTHHPRKSLVKGERFSRLLNGGQ